jgi:hypothetical protein
VRERERERERQRENFSTSYGTFYETVHTRQANIGKSKSRCGSCFPLNSYKSKAVLGNEDTPHSSGKLAISAVPISASGKQENCIFKTQKIPLSHLPLYFYLDRAHSYFAIENFVFFPLHSYSVNGADGCSCIICIESCPIL